MADCLIALGANLGDRAATLDAALAAISADPQTRVVARSSYHETPAIGGPAGQQPFLNAAARIDTLRSCEATWEMLANVERQLGRVRDVRWGPRTVDLDLLLYDKLELATPQLEIPHPRMAFRRFVLAPAAEVAADMRHPSTGWTIAQLLAHLDVRPNYVALAGPIGAGKSQLAQQLGTLTGWRVIHEPVVDARLSAYYADRCGTTRNTETAILEERSRLLAREVWDDPVRWTVSDFWFDQSLAFAEWAAREGNSGEACAGSTFLDVVDGAWSNAASKIAQPKIVVWLDAPDDLLLERIRLRGREYEQRLSAEDLDALRRALLGRLRRHGVGPVLRLDAARLDLAAVEVRAAAEAMA